MKNTKYIHLNSIVKYIKKKEGIDFKIESSTKYGISDLTSFKVIIPASFNVSSMKLVEGEDEFSFFTVYVLDENGNNAMDGANILLWDSELYSTEKEKSVCVSEESIENGILIFENFENIPPFVDSLDIIMNM